MGDKVRVLRPVTYSNAGTVPTGTIGTIEASYQKYAAVEFEGDDSSINRMLISKSTLEHLEEK